MSAPFVALLRRIFARFSFHRGGGAGLAGDGVPAWIGCEPAHLYLLGALRPAERS